MKIDEIILGWGLSYNFLQLFQNLCNGTELGKYIGRNDLQSGLHKEGRGMDSDILSTSFIIELAMNLPYCLDLASCLLSL